MKTTIYSLALAVVSLRLVAANTSEGYTTHEWGTFTSVQGADGVQREWNPLFTTELPTFVYDLAKPSGNPRRASTAFGAKSAFRTLQRMETPVIYFYSDRERSVDVTVRFPQGIITEWYPQVSDIGPSFMRPHELFSAIDNASRKVGVQVVNLSSIDTKKSINESLIRWKDVKILPAKTRATDANVLPTDKSGSHYYAARETDADFLRVNAKMNGATKDEWEKFIFYRGVASFTAPLQVTTGSEADYVSLHNAGTNELAHLFVLQMRGGEGKFLYVDRLPAGEDKTVKLMPNKDLIPQAELASQISEQMRRALVSAGLYQREAAAMVKTWRDSWFEEQGLRVLYVLPRAWTDNILPMTLDPKPAELVRVMVGRAEVITPAMEWEFLKQIVRYHEADPAAKQKVIAETRQLGLGRFAEPTARKVLGNTPSREFSNLAWELLEAVGKPEKEKANAVAQR
jgi:hypothetical protein